MPPERQVDDTKVYAGGQIVTDVVKKFITEYVCGQGDKLPQIPPQEQNSITQLVYNNFSPEEMSVILGDCQLEIVFFLGDVVQGTREELVELKAYISMLDVLRIILRRTVFVNSDFFKSYLMQLKTAYNIKCDENKFRGTLSELFENLKVEVDTRPPGSLILLELPEKDVEKPITKRVEKAVQEQFPGVVVLLVPDSMKIEYDAVNTTDTIGQLEV